MINTGYFTSDDCDLDAFKTLCTQTLVPAQVPLATDVQKNVPIYDVAQFPDLLNNRTMMSEWARTLLNGAGVLVLKNAYVDTSAIDAATAIFTQIIADEKAAGANSADHFSAGTNDRVWNSLGKLCLADPETFARYFGNPAIQAVSEAWLGPNYQMTAQVNLVHPGGAAQQAHRDYHLGFQTSEVSAGYPAHVHDLSPVLTLQGAVAHCDMSVDSGPTKLLPFSQAFRAGYAAWRLPEFRAYFEEAYIQLPLAKGDALFFNPALFHAAGENRTTDVHRMANLLQVSSAFGRALENIDRTTMCRALFPVLSQLELSDTDKNAAIASCAEGYSFPTNLDSDPPVGGLAPETQAALFHRALNDGMDAATFNAALDDMTARKRA